MTWLALIKSVLVFMNALTGYMRDRRLLSAGQALEAREALTNALDAIQKANDARARADRNNADPSRLRDNDGFRRD